jgi:hypothetical protein
MRTMGCGPRETLWRNMAASRAIQIDVARVEAALAGRPAEQALIARGSHVERQPRYGPSEVQEVQLPHTLP